MIGRTWGPITAVVVAIIAMALAMTGMSQGVIGLLLGLVLVLVLPGYTLTRAIFPEERMGGVQQTVLTLGLSLATAVLGGLLLNETLRGLQARPWALLVGGITISAGVASLWRHPGRLSKVAAKSGWERGVLRGIPIWGAVIVVAVMAIAVARLGAIRQTRPGFTQLWLLPATEYGEKGIRIGVRNQELQGVRYQMEVRVGSAEAVRWDAIELGPGEQWETSVILSADLLRQGVEARLYRAGNTAVPYRWAALRFAGEKGD